MLSLFNLFRKFIKAFEAKANRAHSSIVNNVNANNVVGGGASSLPTLSPISMLGSNSVVGIGNASVIGAVNPLSRSTSPGPIQRPLSPILSNGNNINSINNNNNNANQLHALSSSTSSVTSVSTSSSSLDTTHNSPPHSPSSTIDNANNVAPKAATAPNQMQTSSSTTSTMTNTGEKAQWKSCFN